jgi:RNA polymerase sigma factor (sigma-70 family)
VAHATSYERASGFLAEACSPGHKDDRRAGAGHTRRWIRAAFLRYRTGDTALAEELLGDTCERALRARRRFDPSKGSTKTWIYAIALNCLSDHVRRKTGEGRALELLATGPGFVSSEELEIDELVDDELDGLADRERLERALARLTDVEREAISLRFGADLTVPEIAKLTGEQLTTVESRVYRALEKLRDAMG